MSNERALIEKLDEVQEILNEIGYINAFKKELKELNDAINRNTRELSKLSSKIDSIKSITCEEKTEDNVPEEVVNTEEDKNVDDVKKRILLLTEERNKQEEMIMTDPSDSEKYEAEIDRLNKEIQRLKNMIE